MYYGVGVVLMVIVYVYNTFVMTIPSIYTSPLFYFILLCIKIPTLYASIITVTM